MQYDFTLRVFKDSYQPIWYDFNHITISDITLVTKQNKFDYPCLHNGNKKRFGYQLEIIGKFLKVAGSNSAPILAFKSEFIDINIKSFPRFPSIYQCKYHARNIMNGFKDDSIDNGFERLHFEILNLTTNDKRTIKSNF